MDIVTCRFEGLDGLIDDVHRLFDACRDEKKLSPPLGEEDLDRMRLAVHEWMANLVQHAEFDERDPEIKLSLVPRQEHVRCIVEDNSEGFDIGPHLEASSTDILETFPERGMGLMLLASCATDLSYRQGEEKCRIDFLVDSTE